MSAAPSFHWQDPLLLDAQLTEHERMVRDAARAHGAERVLILDWDVHHGNGTNEIFHASDEVLFVSAHESPLYPGSGPASDEGSGEGEGYTVNLPVPGGEGTRPVVSAGEYGQNFVRTTMSVDPTTGEPQLDPSSGREVLLSYKELGTQLIGESLVEPHGWREQPVGDVD
mgnify:CR=1 FL=1